ncbi:hypothetical protein LCGC14_3134780, partial [marine sediment metagenome]
PKEFSRFKGALAGLGDAITAMATVRAGGTPPAIGASTVIRQQRLAGEKLRIREAEASKRDISNRLRIGAFLRKEEALLKKEEDARKPGKGTGSLAPQVEVITDSEGNVYFAATNKVPGGKLGTDVQYVPLSAGAPPIPIGKVRKATQALRFKDAAGGTVTINPLTGEVKPLQEPSTVTDKPSSAKAGKQVQPRPRTEDVRRAGFSLSVLDSMNTLRELSERFKAKDPSLLPTLAKQAARIGETGRALIGSIDPELELFQSNKELIGEQIAFLITGQQMSEGQAQRLINQLPSAALLTTKEGQRTFEAKLAKAERFFLTILKTNAISNPEVFSAEDIKE